MLELTNYIAKRDRLQKILSSIRVVLSDFNLKAKEESVKADFYRLDDEKFNLVVVGEFSRGKSTFVNALLGRRMLPVSKSPTTAVISKIIYGETSEYIVHYKSGESKTISEEEFLDIKAQSEGDVLSLDRLKDKLKSLVKHQEKLDDMDFVEIRYPLPLCRNNVEVVDTPGTNDLNAGRVDITYNYLKKADAAILVLMATQALTKSEMKFLREQIIGNQVTDIFIVINGKDQCKTEDEQERVIKYVSDNLATVVPHELKVFLVSSKQALTWRRKENGEKLPMSAIKFLPKSIEQTGFSEFEEIIGKFLDDERGRAKLEKYITRAKNYLDSINEQIESQYDAADHSTDELKEQLAIMQPKVKKVKLDVSQVIQAMKMRLLSRKVELTNEGDRCFNAMRTATLSVLDDCSFDEAEVKHKIDVATTPIQKEFIERCTYLQQNWIKTEWDQAVKELKEIWQDADIKFGNDISKQDYYKFSLRINIDSSYNENMTCLLTPSNIIWGTIAVLTGMGAFLVALLAVVHFLDKNEKESYRSTLKEELRKKFNDKYDDFIKSITIKYESNIETMCNNLFSAIEDKLNDMEQRLESVIQMKEASEGNAAKIMAKLKEKKSVVERLHQELNEVMA